MKESKFSYLKESIFLTAANHLPRLPWFDHIRYKIYKIAGLKICGRCEIWGPLIIRPIGAAKNIRIGEGTFINTNVRFGVPVDEVVIGRNVHIGPQVMFETVNHDLQYTVGVGRRTWTMPIIVQDEAWIGAGAIITQGVTIGRGAVVAAGAVVTKSIDSAVVVGGIPAKVLKKISPYVNPAGNH